MKFTGIQVKGFSYAEVAEPLGFVARAKGIVLVTLVNMSGKLRVNSSTTEGET